MLSRLLDKYTLLENEQVVRYCTIIVSVMLITVLLSLLMQIYQTYVYQPQTNKTSTVLPAKQHNYKTQTITSLNLFGQFAAGNEQQLDKLNLPQTRLQLVLRGAFTSSDPSSSSAMIEIPGQKTHTFKINSTVYGNAKLHTVYRDRVVLSSNGQLETLYFPLPQTHSDQRQSMTKTNILNTQNVAQVPSEMMDLIRENATLNDVKAVASELTSTTITAEQRQQLIRQRLYELRNRAKK